jgi:hypothetical protein
MLAKYIIAVTTLFTIAHAINTHHGRFNKFVRRAGETVVDATAVAGVRPQHCLFHALIYAHSMSGL